MRLDRWRAWLAQPALPYRLAALALLLTLPALAVGVQLDDYFHREVLLGAASPAAAMRSMFVFLDGDPARAQRLMDAGALPWWTLPTVREALWRPLAALTHWMDYRLWPQAPALMHAHSLLWYALLIAAVTAFYRRVGGTAGAVAAGLAALLYAVDDAHGFAVGWLANRNGLMAALFGVLCVHAHMRWRREGWRPGVWLSPLCLALALLSAEAGLATLAYLTAYTLCLDTRPWRRRMLALLPVGLVAVCWAIVYRALGYGAWGAAYIDPLREPLAYAAAAVVRAPVLLLGQWLGVPAELFPFLGPAARAAILIIAVCVVLGLGVLFVPLVRRSPLARFWAVGMLLSLLPICAALPANRNLLFVGLGGMGLLAEWFKDNEWLTPDARVQMKKSVVRLPPAPYGGRLSSFVLLSSHLMLAPALLPITTLGPALLGNLEPAVLSLPSDPALMSQTVVLVNAPSFFSASFLAPIRAAHGLPAPARVRYLGAGPAALTLTRTDTHTLEVRPDGGYLTGFDTVFRGLHHPLAVGETTDSAGMTATVLALTSDRRPAAVAFRFSVPLEDDALRWVAWRQGVFVPFALPAVGESVRLDSLLGWP